MIIVDLIKEYMYQKKLSIWDVANATGLSYEKIWNIVERDMIPIPEDADTILRMFGVTLEEVLKLY